MNEVIYFLDSEKIDFYLVGGSVRDGLLGITTDDFDIEVYNIDFNYLISILNKKFTIDIINYKFKTIKIKNTQLSFARTESKSGDKHNDFILEFDNINTFIGSCRRDFTINSLMYDYRNNLIIDYHNGINDLNNKIIKATYYNNFVLDGLRVFRAIRFALVLGFEIEVKTFELCKKMDIMNLKSIHIFNELEKFFNKSNKIYDYLHLLKQMNKLYWFQEFNDIEIMKEDFISMENSFKQNDILYNLYLMAKILKKNNLNSESFIERIVENKKFKQIIRNYF